jgi:hypothetical protein
MKKFFAAIFFVLLGEGCSTTATYKNEVVYIYEEGIEIKPISIEHDHRVRSRISEYITESRELWFVLIIDNDQMYIATIYFKPERKTGRIRNGSMHTLGYFDWILSDNIPLEDTLDSYFYIQSTVGPELIKPSPEHLPFAVGGSLSEKTILEIVDFTQPLLKESDGVIMSIREKGPEVIEVRTAKERRPLAGYGTVFTFSIKNGKLTFISRHNWVS